MKKFLIFFGLIIFLGGMGWGQTTYTWNTGTGDWNVSANWTSALPGTYPVDGDTANIPSGTVNLTADVTVTNITVTAGASITGSGFDMTLNGNATFNGGATGLGELEIGGDAVFGAAIGAAAVVVIGSSNINANITTSGAQTYNGAVTLGGNVTFTGNSGTLVQFGNTVSGNAAGRTLTVTTANVQFGGVVGVGAAGTFAPGAVTVNGTTAGTATITTTGITTTTGGQNYGGPVVLGANVTFTGNSGTLVQFGNTVSGNAAGRTLTVTTANARFEGAVSGNIASVTVANGTTYISTNTITTTVTTGNGQSYAGQVTLANGVNFTGGGGSTIRFGGAVTGATTDRTLTVTTANARFEGAVSGNIASVNVANGTTYISTNTITTTVITGNGQSYAGQVTLANGVNFTGGGGSTIRFLGAVTGATTARTLTVTTANARFEGEVSGNIASVNVANGTTYISTDTITTTATTGNGQSYAGQVTLANGVNFTGGSGSTIRFGNTVSGNAADRTLTVTTANARFEGAVSGNIASVAVDGTSAINANITTTGAQTYSGTVTIGNAAVSLSGSDLNIQNGVNPSSPRLQLIAVDNVTLSGSIEVSYSGYEGTGATGASVYVSSSVLTLNLGCTITLPGDASSGGAVCANIDNYNSSGTITGGRGIHFHNGNVEITSVNKHLVYRDGPDLGDLLGAGVPYLYVQAESLPAASSPILNVQSGYSAYIIAVLVSNSRSPTFNVDGAGFIEFRGNYISSGSLTLNPGEGGVHLNDAVILLTNSPFEVNDANGNSKDIILNGTSDSAITAEGITFDGTVNGANNLILTSGIDTDININKALGTADVPLSTLIVNNQGNLNTVAAAVITAGSFSQTGGGPVSISGNISVTNTTPANASIAFNSLLTTVGSPVFATPATGGSVSLARGQAGPTLTLAAGTGIMEFYHGSTFTLSNIAVTSSDNGAVVIPAGRTIEFATSGTLNLTNGAWIMGAANNSAGRKGFYGIDDEIILGAGFELLTTDFSVGTAASGGGPHEFTIGGPGVTITASGNVTINKTFNDALRNSTLIMTGGDLALRQDAVNPVEIGNFTVGDAATGSLITGATISGDHNIINIVGDVTINTNWTLVGGNNTIWIYPPNNAAPGNTWKQNTGGSFDYDYNTSAVEFGKNTYRGHTYKIIGNTTWRTLACYEPAADLLFSNYPDTHTIRYRMIVKPQLPGTSTTDETPASMIRLSREEENGDDVLGYGDLIPFPFGIEEYAPPDDVNECFWHFELYPGAEFDFDNVFLNYCWSKNRIPLPTAPVKFLVVATPYVYNDGSTHNYALGNPRTISNPEDYIKYAYYNVNWFVADYFFYSFTEDSNGNGRIDRIRAQAGFSLDGNFIGFSVRLSNGYTVNTNLGNNGYDLVSAKTLEPTDADSIYIYVNEKEYSDGEGSISWRIESRGSLYDSATRSVLMNNMKDDFDITIDYHTIDTVPPRINYAFALPEHEEIFFQVSEPLGSAIDLDSPSGTLNNLNSKEFLITGSPRYSLLDLAGGIQNFEIREVRDLADYVRDLRSQPMDPSDPSTYYTYQFPSPKYPVSWDYSHYIEIRGWYDGPGSIDNKSFMPVTGNPNDLPPIKDWYYNLADYPSAPPLNTITSDYTSTSPNPGNKMYGYSNGLPDMPSNYGKGSHRVTDLLISIPPKTTVDSTYFVWPIWARLDDSSAAPSGDLGTTDRPGYGYMGQSTNPFNETTIIWDFTGKRFLEWDDYEVIMQARINTGLPAPELIPVFNISDSFKSTGVHGSPGLWNPGQPPWNDPGNVPPPYQPPPFANMVPKWFNGSYLSPGTTSADPLYTYIFNNNFGQDGMIEFFFRFGTVPELLAGRLDMVPGTSIPADWYRRIRAFSFGVHNITRQRSGVTILNNVINSDKRERVFLDYRLNKSGRVTIQVFTMDGNLIRVLENKSMPADSYRVSWDGTNQRNQPVARGMYFIRIVAPEIDEIRKVMVVK